MKRTLFLAIGLLAALGSRAQNWPSFRGPNASGVADGQDPPLTWDAQKGINVLWKTPIPGLAHSSPIIWGNRLYVTTAISRDPKADFRYGKAGEFAQEPAQDRARHTWRVYCLDKNTGKIVWQRTAAEGVPQTKRHPASSQAAATPATDGKLLVAYFGSEGLYCYDMNGKLVWKQDLGVIDPGWFLEPDFQWGVGSSPIIYKKLVIVQCDRQKDSFIAAFAFQEGKRIWLTPRQEIPSWGTPTVYEGKSRAELVTNATKSIRGYDPLTGRELWRLSPNSETTIPTPIVAHDLIFVTNGYPKNQPIYAIRPGATGDISLKDNEESNQYIAWSKKRGGPAIPTPIVYGDYLYTCSEKGILAAYNAKTGERVHQQRISEKGGSFMASPVAADGKLYFASEDGEIYVVKTGPKYELLATNPVGEVLMATPAISEGAIFVRSQHHVYAFGARKQATNRQKP